MRFFKRKRDILSIQILTERDLEKIEMKENIDLEEDQAQIMNKKEVHYKIFIQY